MNKIFKMDIHRLLHSKVFYVAIAFITIMAVALVMSGMSTDLNGLLGVSSGAAATGDNFGLSTAMHSLVQRSDLPARSARKCDVDGAQLLFEQENIACERYINHVLQMQ